MFCNEISNVNKITQYILFATLKMKIILLNMQIPALASYYLICTYICSKKKRRNKN